MRLTFSPVQVVALVRDIRVEPLPGGCRRVLIQPDPHPVVGAGKLFQTPLGLRVTYGDKTGVQLDAGGLGVRPGQSGARNAAGRRVGDTVTKVGALVVKARRTLALPPVGVRFGAFHCESPE